MGKRINKMDLQARKITFVQEFLRLQNEGIISGLENMLRNKKSEMYEKGLNPMSLDQFNDEIDQALEDSDNDRITKAADLKAKYQ